MQEQKEARKQTQECVHRFYKSPLGLLHLMSQGDSLVGLAFDKVVDLPSITKETSAREFSAMKSAMPAKTHLMLEFCKNTESSAESAVMIETIKWLDMYFSGEIPNFTPRIAFTCGSSFAREVWECLLKVPFGNLSTYGTLAKFIAKRHKKPMSAQAIGGALHRNPIAIILPCHRIISANGNLGGYVGGIDKKATLLRLEGFNIKENKVQM